MTATFLKIAGDYSNWKVYRKSVIICDITELFIRRALPAGSRTVDQMRQAARSYCIKVDDPSIFVNKCRERSDETVANIMITQIRQLDSMLAKTLKSIEAEFLSSGGVREAMTAARRNRRGY